MKDDNNGDMKLFEYRLTLLEKAVQDFSTKLDNTMLSIKILTEDITAIKKDSVLTLSKNKINVIITLILGVLALVVFSDDPQQLKEVLKVLPL